VIKIIFLCRYLID
jgi:hypothetical protein